MDQRRRQIRQRVAECIRQFMSGHVSCDHLIEEFRDSDDSDVRDVIRLIEEATSHIDRFERRERSESEFKEAMAALIRKLEEPPESA